MTSYRAQLAKIGESGEAPFSYRNFFSRPQSLRRAMRAMEPPGIFEQVKDLKINEDWPQQCQGLAWTGTHWLFTSNGSRPWKGIYAGSSPKAIYSFPGHTDYEDPSSVFTIATIRPFHAVRAVHAEIPTPELVYIDHVGSIIYDKGRVYVDHFGPAGPALLELSEKDGVLSYVGWIPLDLVESRRVALVGIDPWEEENDGAAQHFYTCWGDKNVDRLFLHGRKGNQAGQWTGKALMLTPPITDDCYVQGGAFSDNGHLYIASGNRKAKKPIQHIYCYSPLNGQRLGQIDVPALDVGDEELEGICFADILRNGHRAQIHAVLLDHTDAEKDDIFLKSFGASDPHLV